MAVFDRACMRVMLNFLEIISEHFSLHTQPSKHTQYFEWKSAHNTETKAFEQKSNQS